jgi:lipoprotein-anchoring transpeptidase ErfK/SrfK
MTTAALPTRRHLLMALIVSTLMLSGAHAADPEPADAAPATAREEQSVLRAQVLLERAHFSPGQIDGTLGSSFAGALAGFQRSRGLADDGRLGPDTWAALEADAAPTLVEYTLTEADLAGPFAELPESIPERAALPAMGYESAEEALGERFHASPELLKTLNPQADLDQVGAVLQVPNVLDLPALPTPAKIVVTESTGILSLVDADDTVLAQFPASMGSEHDPLPIGDWTVTTIAENPVFNYDPALLRTADQDSEPAQLPAGPNNPVGAVWIGISKPHYGIHGTPDPMRVGKTESNGCIRLTNWSVRRLAQVVAVGMPVEMRE